MHIRRHPLADPYRAFPARSSCLVFSALVIVARGASGFYRRARRHDGFGHCETVGRPRPRNHKNTKITDSLSGGFLLSGQMICRDEALIEQVAAQPDHPRFRRRCRCRPHRRPSPPTHSGAERADLHDAAHLVEDVSSACPKLITGVYHGRMCRAAGVRTCAP